MKKIIDGKHITRKRRKWYLFGATENMERGIRYV